MESQKMPLRKSYKEKATHKLKSPVKQNKIYSIFYSLYFDLGISPSLSEGTEKSKK